jgi:hypothetical protein
VTGCDSTPSFLRKAKSKPFTILESNEEIQRQFSYLGMSETVGEDTVQSLYSKLGRDHYYNERFLLSNGDVKNPWPRITRLEELFKSKRR